MFAVQTQQAGIGRTNWDGCMSARQADGGIGYTGLYARCPCQGTASGHQHRYRTAAVLSRPEHRRGQGCSRRFTCPEPRRETSPSPRGCGAAPWGMPRSCRDAGRGLPAAGPNRCGSGSGAGRRGRGSLRQRPGRPLRSSRCRAALHCARGCCT